MAQRVLNFFREHSHIGNNVLRLLRSYLRLSQQMDMPELAEEDSEEELSQVLSRIASENNELSKVGHLLEEEWGKLEEWRRWMKFASTGIVLRKIKQVDAVEAVFQTMKEEDIPEPIRAFLGLPVYTLKEIKDRKLPEDNKNENRNIRKQDAERIAAIKRCYLQVQIFFNNTVVATSEEAVLEPSFTANFGTIYNLRVFERVEELKVTIRERFGRGAWQTLANVFIPVPGTGAKAIAAATDEGDDLDGMEFASDITRGGYRNSLGARVDGVWAWRLLFWY